MTPLPQFKGVPTDVVCTAEGLLADGGKRLAVDGELEGD